MKRITAASILVLLMALAPGASQAGDVDDRVTDQTMAAYCATVPLDSHTTATLPARNGGTVTGRVHCEAEDLIVGSDDFDDDYDDSDDRSDDDDHRRGGDDDRDDGHHSHDDGHHSGDDSDDRGDDRDDDSNDD